MSIVTRISLAYCLGAILAPSVHAVSSGSARSAAVTPNIRLNQLGFHPQGPKTAAVVGAPAGPFALVSAAGDTVFRGQLGEEKLWEASGERARLADFSAAAGPGEFVLAVPGLGESTPFPIGPRPHEELSRGTLRAYYYNRSSTALDRAQAGKWARAAGHPDRRVVVHPSAASPTRAAGSMIVSPQGWYDAGDYGKYVVNSGISTYTLLALYRHFPAYFDTLNLNIPESGNNLPDLLDEVLWNLRWMLTMQDPGDGGVYHKLTTPNFPGAVMPEADLGTRYVVKKSTTAALNLAAVAAYASRVFRALDDRLPGFADSCLDVSKKAWQWARSNPAVYYRQTEMNTQFQPSITTGEYGDGNATDEFQWAGAELYLATKADSFYQAAYPTAIPAAAGVPGWNSVGTLGLYSMAVEGDAGFPRIDTALVRKRILDAAAQFRTNIAASPFQIPMISNSNFFWGSNSYAGNVGMLLLIAYRLSGDTTLLKPAVDALDYLLGRNGPGYCFVTGFGKKSPMHIHHRPSEADANAEPVPGFLAGGPNSGRQDGCTYPSTLPALSYSDTECSYASNEVTINWNAPLAYLVSGLNVIYSGNGGTQSIRGGPAQAGRSALLAWEGGAPRLSLPPGLTGRVDFFDGMGRAWLPGRSGDSSQAARPGLLFYRLHVQGGGKALSRAGSWSPLAALRIPL